MASRDGGRRRSEAPIDTRAAPVGAVIERTALGLRCLATCVSIGGSPAAVIAGSNGHVRVVIPDPPPKSQRVLVATAGKPLEAKVKVLPPSTASSPSSPGRRRLPAP